MPVGSLAGVERDVQEEIGPLLTHKNANASTKINLVFDFKGVFLFNYKKFIVAGICNSQGFEDGLFIPYYSLKIGSRFF